VRLISNSRTPPRVAGRAIGVAIFVATLELAACSTTPGDFLPTAMGGLPAETPARPAISPDYLPVHAMPPPRAATALTEAEQKKLQDDLAAVRDHQEEIGKAPPPGGDGGAGAKPPGSAAKKTASKKQTKAQTKDASGTPTTKPPAGPNP